jgi:tRNA dimethylallyltransferase
VVRALEVGELTGGPFRATMPAGAYARPAVQVGLDVSREVLDDRIAARVDRMWRAGLVDEVRRLDAAGLSRGPTAARALGYAQVLRLLAGELSDDEARAQTVAATRRYARRQESWFRRDPRVTWLRHDDPDLVARVADLASTLAP